MKKLVQIMLLSTFLGFLYGCSSGTAEEAAPKGSVPEIKQAEPGMLSPEERGRQNTGGGEGTR